MLSFFSIVSGPSYVCVGNSKVGGPPGFTQLEIETKRFFRDRNSHNFVLQEPWTMRSKGQALCSGRLGDAMEAVQSLYGSYREASEKVQKCYRRHTRLQKLSVCSPAQTVYSGHSGYVAYIEAGKAIARKR